MRGLLSLFFISFFLLLLLPTRPAQAQIPGLDLFDTDTSIPDFQIRIGWPDADAAWSLASAERPVPIRVTFQGGDEPVQGLVMLNYLQDSSQNARIVAPYATTPGATSHIDLVATFPANLETIALTVRAGPKDSVTQDLLIGEQVPGRLIPAAFETGAAIIAHVGPRPPNPAVHPKHVSLQDIGDVQSTNGWRPEDTPLAEDLARWLTVEVAGVFPSELPAQPSAYEGLAALVVDRSVIRDIAPRARRAIQAWTESGGRLVILTGAAGDEWLSLLPPSLTAAARMPVTHRPGQRLPINDEIRQRAAEATQLGAQPQPDPPAISQRLFTITDEGRRQGWRLRWNPDAAPGAVSGADSKAQAPIAHGPAGFGWITLIGVAPDRVPPLLDEASAAEVWRDILAHAATLRLAELPSTRRYYTAGSGANPLERGAITTGITTASGQGAEVAPLFIGLIAGLGLLMLLLGPIDFFVLKRLRLRHLSWLTASAYILVFTLAAAVIPRLVRTGDTEANRVETIDILTRAQPDTPITDATPPLAYRSGLTGLNSQSSAPFQIEPDALGPGVAWRGVSSVPSYQANPGAALPAVTYAAFSAPQPAAPIPAPLWTYRALVDHGPVTPTPDQPLPAADLFIAEPGEFPAYTAELRNLTPGDSVRDIRLLTRHTDLAVDETPPFAVPDSGLLTLNFSARREPSLDRRSVLLNDPPETARLGPDPTALPGVLDRNRAIASRLDSAAWGLLILTIDRAEPALPITERTRDNATPTAQRAVRYVRLLLPLPQSEPTETEADETEADESSP